MPGIGPCEGPGRRRQLGDLGGDEVTGEVDSDRLVGCVQTFGEAEIAAARMA